MRGGYEIDYTGGASRRGECCVRHRGRGEGGVAWEWGWGEVWALRGEGGLRGAGEVREAGRGAREAAGLTKGAGRTKRAGRTKARDAGGAGGAMGAESVRARAAWDVPSPGTPPLTVPPRRRVPAVSGPRGAGPGVTGRTAPHKRRSPPAGPAPR